MLNKFLITAITLLSAQSVMASGGVSEIPDLTHCGLGIFAVALFTVAYIMVMMEEQLHLSKSKPVIVAAGFIWVLVALTYQSLGKPDHAHAAIINNLAEYVELFLFLLAAMTYVNAMEERNVFMALRTWLVSKGYTLRTLFWMTGALAFIISPIADNLTTALLMGAVAMAVGGKNRAFIVAACINIVVAANAGGAFSPFGDITTLMVWQKGKVSFFEFFAIFIPSVINWLVPAVIMSLTVSKEKPDAGGEAIRMKVGAKRIMALFLVTIVTAVSFHNFLHLPPAVGMMLGLGFLSLFAHYLRKLENRINSEESFLDETGHKHSSFDFFHKVANAEWDTLLFFYGVILCVGGLGQFGYLVKVSNFFYDGLGHTTANVLVGILSAIIDNIPVMFAVLTMDPQMSHGQWLLVTLTAGVGGSLLSIGSAAGVALMGSARGVYTFSSHLKWSWAIALGYAASVVAHLYLNARFFT